jgi:predicted 3-demethylubiquinone-9 3-methyltransferase (glyoxalase superfamily)
LAGQEYWAVNGGSFFRFTEAISLYVRYETQQELDFLWEKLSQGGSTSVCGWLTDRYGVSWQIVPQIIDEMLSDSDPARVRRVMKAVFNMEKLSFQALQEAYRA